MKDRIDISVIVPFYNVEEYLAECLDSLLRQGGVSLEVIMIDDGSTDKSGAVADDYAKKNAMFSCHHVQNGGPGRARNIGTKYAKGDYIVFADGDDIVPDNTYEKMLSVAKANNAELTICNAERFNSSKHWASGLHKKTFLHYEKTTHITKNYDLLYDTAVWNKMVKRDFYERNAIRFPEDLLYEDIPTAIQMHLKCNKVAMVKEVGYLWRVRDGATKSITQMDTIERNFFDRMKIISLIDSMFEKEVQDKGLKKAKQIRLLNLDLKLFIDQYNQLPESKAETIINTIIEYIEKNIDDGIYESLPLLDQQKYLNVRSRNFKALTDLLNYQNYYDEPVIEENGRLSIQLPNDLFTIQTRDITEEFENYPPRVYIDDIKRKKERIIITSHLYWRRFSINNNEQQIRVFLSNYLKRTEIDVRLIDSFELTNNFGTVINNRTGEKHRYNYNGAGFEFEIALDLFEKEHIDEGTYHIEIEYENRLFRGIEILKGCDRRQIKEFDNSYLISDETVAEIRFSRVEELLLFIKKEPILIEAVKANNKSIDVQLNREAEIEVYAINQGRNTLESIELIKVGPLNYQLDINKLNKEELYCFATEKHADNKLLIKKKKATIFKDDVIVIASSVRSNTTFVYVADSIAYIEKSKVKKGKAFLTIDYINSKLELTKIIEAKIVVIDECTYDSTVISSADTIELKENVLQCNFTINLGDDAVTKDLYEGTRDIYIEYIGTGEKLYREKLYSETTFSYSRENKSIYVLLYRSIFANIRLQARQIWPDEQSSQTKRTQLVKKEYPRYIQKPIRQNRILFESMQGRKYSCNPRAIYEYIDSNYPEYECIWALEDVRTNIKGNGKRIRRGSLEYYYYLATSKYLVNNGIFPNDYIKREGQIVIQTMQGTPLKTFGLDVPGDINTQLEQELYVKNNSNWDFLVIQGLFVEKKVQQMFGVSPQLLKTGYPRTDKLIDVKEEKIESLKKKLGLPLDKKVILYSPTWRAKNRFDMKLDLEAMRQQLSEEYVLLIRIHYFSSKGYTIPADREFIFNFNNYNSIEDLYLISDIMITDYSSSMFDYLLLNKPIVLFTYDIKEYHEKLRGLYVDLLETAPGPVCMTTEEVIDTINNINEAFEKNRSRIEAIKNEFLTYEQSNSTNAIVNKAFNTNRLSLKLYILGTRTKRIIRNVLK